MIDYGCKAPTDEIIIGNLIAARLGRWVEASDEQEAHFEPVEGLAIAFLGQLVRQPAVLDEAGEIVTPAVLTVDQHADLRFFGPDAQAMLNRLKARTTIAGRTLPDPDGAPITEARASDGFAIFPHEAVATPAHRFA